MTMLIATLDHTATADEIDRVARFYGSSYSLAGLVNADLLDCWLETVCVEAVNATNQAVEHATKAIQVGRRVGIPSIAFQEALAPAVANLRRAHA